jgi:cytochrome c-type biogenesis protein CcmE
MAGLRKKQRVRMIVGGLALLAVAAGLAGYGFREGIEFFRSPTQLAEEPLADGKVFRLGGLVKPGTWQQGAVSTFVVTDGTSDVPVRFSGIVPSLFAEGGGTIVRGTMQDGVFVADEVLAKHDETYMPREVVDALKEQGVWQPGS